MQLNKVDKKNYREYSLFILESAIQDNYEISKYLEDFFYNEARNPDLNHGFIKELAEGTFTRLIQIDKYLELLITKGFNKLPSVIKNILRTAIYQLIAMESLPQYAVINESVKLAKKYGHEGTVKLVNGVLRNFLRQKEQLDEVIEKLSQKEKISIKYSLPLWLVKYWAETIALPDLEELGQALLKKPELYLRINTLKTDIETFKAKLKEENTVYSETELPELIKLANETRLNTIYGYEEGLFYIQDLGAAMVSHLLEPKENEFIIDLCAFPGGKTSHLAQLMNNTGKIIAVDSSSKRKKRFIENTTRLGCNNIETIIGLSEKNLELTEKADKILVDAPCSGLGIIRRKPEIKYTKTKEDLFRLAKIQKDILLNATKYLKDSGTIVYSTCTFSPIENELMLKSFIEENPSFIIKEQKQMLTHKDLSDCFFVALIEKKIYFIK